jgi:hypothetical protein
MRQFHDDQGFRIVDSDDHNPITRIGTREAHPSVFENDISSAEGVTLELDCPYFQRYFSESVHSTVALAQTKILWAHGDKEGAIDRLQATLTFLSMQQPKQLEDGTRKSPPREFADLIATLKKKAPPGFVIPAGIEELLELHQEQPGPLEQCFREMFASQGVDARLESRIHKILGGYLFAARRHTREVLEEVSAHYDSGRLGNPDDYKQWLGWAYAN